MSFKYERKINYYETDKMGVVHHSNYIRYLEEARTAWLDVNKMPFEEMEEKGITIPVLGVKCNYKTHVTFGDTVIIIPHLKEYTGVRFTVCYDFIEKESKRVVLTGETKHCFTSKELRPVNMKKQAPMYHEKFEKLHEEYLKEKEKASNG